MRIAISRKRFFPGVFRTEDVCNFVSEQLHFGIFSPWPMRECFRAQAGVVILTCSSSLVECIADVCVCFIGSILEMHIQKIHVASQDFN